MSTQLLKVLVYGGTGTQASPLVHELLRRGHTPLVLSRSHAKAAALAEAGATIAIGNLSDRAQLTALSAEVDAVALLIPFFVLNPADALTYGRNAIDAAREAGVKLIVWNASGAIPPVPTGNPSIDLRIEIAEHLNASGVPHIIIQPTVYAENLLGPWTAPFVANQDQVAYPTPPDLRIGWIAAADVALLIATALERPGLAGRSFVVGGIERPNGPELAAAFSDGLGRPISYYAMPPREFGAILDAAFGPGAGEKAAAEYERVWQSDPRPVMYADMQPILEALPIQLRTLQQWVAEHAALFNATPVIHA